MIENMEMMVLNLFTAICDRPLPSGGFPGKLTYFYPCKCTSTTSIYHSFMPELSHYSHQDCGLGSFCVESCTPLAVWKISLINSLLCKSRFCLGVK